jgi:hypothetical protein
MKYQAYSTSGTPKYVTFLPLTKYNFHKYLAETICIFESPKFILHECLLLTYLLTYMCDRAQELQ